MGNEHFKKFPPARLLFSSYSGTVQSPTLRPGGVILLLSATPIPARANNLYER